MTVISFAWYFLFTVQSGGESPRFERDIRPIFRTHCFDCHGATDERKGNLDLRLVRFMVQGGETGPAIAPGEPEKSHLLNRIRNREMPPGKVKLNSAEIQIIEQWIKTGAKTVRPEPETIAPGLPITEEERSFWSFQPVRRPVLPAIESFAAAPLRTPLDAIVLADSGKLAPEADRRATILRAYFDLTGLPPEPDELRNWLEDPSHDWFDRLINTLLDSPHYGERWARHWLDIAGYADSEGATVSDADRPWAWKYRDWVIRSLNADKPFDQFITEQLAGDELAGPQSGDLTERQIDLLTATGYLRMAADGTGSGSDTPEARNQVMADTLKIVGTSLLGLSVQCAQCHDHRYDPIPQADYYALRAVFEPALDWRAWQPPAARLVSLYTASDRQRAAEIESEAQQIVAEKQAKQAEYMRQALDKELMKYDEPLRQSLREAYETVADKRSDEHKKLLAEHPSVNISPGVLYQYLPAAAEDLKKFDQRINETRAKKPPEQFLRALVEPPNHTPETRLFHRGDHQQPKQPIAPGSLSITAPDLRRPEFAPKDPSLPTTGRRLAFARWLTARDNPLFARVIVNRVWMHHFGKGIVTTPADFGKLGVPPSHARLLDWLADEFVTSGWSLKQLHRTIMTSSVWRQAAHPDAAFRTALMRLEAEAIRDRMLAASGQLDRQLFGPPVKVKEDETGQVVVDHAHTRRGIYIQTRRSQPLAMLQAFDAPVMETNCEVRSASTVATQSLMLLNGDFILHHAAKLADRAAAEAAPIDPTNLVGLPAMANPPALAWQYGYGSFDESSNRTREFHRLSHWTGSQWQAGPALPDPALGYVLLNAGGGHPDVPDRAVIRRWTVTRAGSIAINGALSHGSEAGDGVRARVVSSRSGLAGEWTAHHAMADTNIAAIEVQPGDSIDFITDCRTTVTSDSFQWPVTIVFKTEGIPDQVIQSSESFSGPAESIDVIPGQIVRAWQLALSREPTRDELALALAFITRQLETLQAFQAVPKGRSVTRQAMTNLCQALLGSNEFLYLE